MRPQQNYGSGSGVPQQDSRAELMRKANEASAQCNRANRGTPNGKIVESSILVFTETQSNKFDLLSSKARLNDPQKKAFKAFLSEIGKCRAFTLDAYKGTAYLPIIQKDQADKDVIYSKMLLGQISIGDANTALKRINLKTAEEFKPLTVTAGKSQAPISAGNVIGQTFDNQANGNIYLYDGPCKFPNYAGAYPLRWDAKRADNGAFIGEGCYSVTQQQVTMIATTGLTVSRPMSVFQGGGNKSFFQSISEGIQRAADYANKSSAETQRNTTNLTPGLTGGGNMSCTPDGRGGYNCK